MLHLLENVTVPDDFNLPDRPDAARASGDAALYDRALGLIREKKAFLIAHYYTSALMQRLCEEAGGFIGDSLEMARRGRESGSGLLIVAGVRFMGETAKILSPEKTVIMPDLKAECSLDLCCDPEAVIRVQREHPEAVTVAYANTSARVKAVSDWIVTSSLAVELGRYLAREGRPILWVPDRHLGSYIERASGAELYCWPGRCIVHDAFESNAVDFVRREHPGACLLVHPEAPREVVDQADFVGSTSQILNYARASERREFIIATERNIFYKLRQACPGKTFIEAPVASRSGHCISCANCPWMELNTLSALIYALEHIPERQIEVEEQVRLAALRPLDRMLRFSSDLREGRIRI